MSKSLEDQVREWLENEENCGAANDFYGSRAFSHDDLPDFREIADTWCRINGIAPPTHRPHPTVQ